MDDPPEQHIPAIAPAVTGTRLGLVVGDSVTVGSLGHDASERWIETAWGPAAVHDIGTAIVLHRHRATPEGYRPPHRLDHHRSIAALCAAGCDRILALSSVGSLRGWPVGTVVAPFDFFAPTVNPSFFDDARGHSIPGFDEAWRDQVIEAWRAVTSTSLMDGGVYAQTRGPRFETYAEVRMLSQFADIVGMTVASECILAREAGLAYAVLCVVDNLANGLGDASLSMQDFHAGVIRNRARLLDDLGVLLPRLAGTPQQ